MKSLLAKIDATAAVAAIGGLLYLWGYIYWGEYYSALGLPVSSGHLGFERLVAAGSWFLGRFLWRGVGYLLAAGVMAIVLKRAFRMMAARSLRLRSEMGRAALAAATPLGTLVGWALAVVLLDFCYDTSKAYIRADANRDAIKRLDNPLSRARVIFQDQRPLTAFGITNFDLLDQRDGKTYLLTPKLTNTDARVIIVLDSQISWMAVDRLTNSAANP